MASERERLRSSWAEYLENYPKDMPLTRLESIYAEIVRMKLQGTATDIHDDIAKAIKIKIDERCTEIQQNQGEPK